MSRSIPPSIRIILLSPIRYTSGSQSCIESFLKKTRALLTASSLLFIPRSSNAGFKLYPPLLLKPQKSARYVSFSKKKGESDESALQEVFLFDTHTLSPLIGEVDSDAAKVVVLTRCSFAGITDGEVKLFARLVRQASGEKIHLESSFKY